MFNSGSSLVPVCEISPQPSQTFTAATVLYKRCCCWGWGRNSQRLPYTGTPFVFLLRGQTSTLEEWHPDWQPLISAAAWRWLRLQASFCPWEDSQRVQLEMGVKHKVLRDDSVHSHFHPGQLPCRVLRLSSTRLSARLGVNWTLSGGARNQIPVSQT